MYQYIRMNEKNRNDLQEILTQALNELKNELGEKFDINSLTKEQQDMLDVICNKILKM